MAQISALPKVNTAFLAAQQDFPRLGPLPIEDNFYTQQSALNRATAHLSVQPMLEGVDQRHMLWCSMHSDADDAASTGFSV